MFFLFSSLRDSLNYLLLKPLSNTNIFNAKKHASPVILSEPASLLIACVQGCKGITACILLHSP